MFKLFISTIGFFSFLMRLWVLGTFLTTSLVIRLLHVPIHCFIVRTVNHIIFILFRHKLLIYKRLTIGLLWKNHILTIMNLTRYCTILNQMLLCMLMIIFCRVCQEIKSDGVRFCIFVLIFTVNGTVGIILLKPIDER